MIISVSGVVGSGKTTVARRAAGVLRRNGFEVSVFGFRSLPCFRFFPSSPKSTTKPASGTAGTSAHRRTRRAGYRQKRLGIGRLCLYLARVLVFRAYYATLPRARVYILNRYFYDAFTHYRFESAVERVCGRILQATIPVPDLAVLVIAREEIIAARRPRYSKEYLAIVGDAYLHLPQRFPELVEFRTDSTGQFDDLDTLVLTKARAHSCARPGAVEDHLDSKLHRAQK